MAFDRKAYMKEWNRRPENRARQKAARKRWHAKPGVLEHLAAKKREQNATDKGKIQQHSRILKFHYGITRKQYEEMLLAQQGLCAICHNPPSDFGRYKNLCVDHNHETGKIRGLLCGRCNLQIGAFEDDIQLLQKAIAYLVKYG